MLGWPHPDPLLERLTARQLAEWRAFFRVGSPTERRSDLRHGILCSLIDACHRAKGQPAPPRRYMLFREDGADDVQSTRQQRATLEAAAAAFGRARQQRRRTG